MARFSSGICPARAIVVIGAQPAAGVIRRPVAFLGGLVLVTCFRLQAVQILGCLAGVGCGGEDSSLVVLQHF